MDKYIICPHTETCPIYKLYQEQADDRLDIIRHRHHESPEGENYSCLALEAVRDAVKGTMNEVKLEVPERFKERFTKTKGLGALEGFDPSECSEVIILNLLSKK